MQKVETPLLVPFATSANFCSQCGMLLRLESTRSLVECRFCHQKVKIEDICSQGSFRTNLTITRGKDWLKDTSATK